MVFGQTQVTVQRFINITNYLYIKLCTVFLQSVKTVIQHSRSYGIEMLSFSGKNLAWMAGSDAGCPMQGRQHENKL